MKAVTPLLQECVRWAIRSVLVGLLTGALTHTASATLTHRYSFTTDATDSIAGANGIVHGGVTFGNNLATFPATVVSGPGADYIELPPGLISNYTSVTFEFWVSVGGNGIWSEIYAFGNQNAGGAGANMVMFTPHSGPLDYRMSYAQADPGYTDEYLANGAGILDGLGMMSVACVYDPPGRTMNLYTNGVLVSSVVPATARFSLTNVYNINSWLGRSMYNGDGAFAGDLDEFRIYDSALSPLQVAVNNVAGPDTLVTTIAVNSIAWHVGPTMTVGGRQDTTVTFNTAQYGSFTLAGSADPTYSSSDPSVISVTSKGQLFAMAVGTATVSAVYNNQTNTVLVTVGPPTLDHRYSFTANVNDSVGTAHGTLVGTAAISGGKVVLPGTGSSGGSPDGYVDLPNNLLTGYTTVTIETWATDNGSANWARIWDLGNSGGGEDVANGGTRYVYLSLPAGGGDLFGAIQLNDRAGGNQGMGWANLGRPPVGQQTHLVWVSDAAHHTGWLYANGALVGSNPNMTITPFDVGPTVNDWLGRSQYNDPMFNGSIDEFRIWNGPLSPLQVALNAAAGPDALGPSDPGALQTIHLTIAAANMVKGSRQFATVSGDFANIANVNVSTLGVSYTSGNTNIATVDANGQITAAGIGTTTITATYGGKSDAKSVTVFVRPTVLAHRWSFNETSGTTVSDSVGTAHGTISAGVILGGGVATVDGVASYIDLPGHIIDGYDAVTFETWVKVYSSTANNSNARLFEFGSADGANEVGVTARTGGQNTFIRYFGSSTVTALRGGNLAYDQKVHLVGIFNPPAGTVDLFLNGSWQNSVTNLGFSLATISNAMSRLGANLATNAFTAADFDEFRVYNGALDLFGIRTSLAAGPENPVMDGGIPSSLALRADSMMVVGSAQVPHVIGNFTGVSNVDLSETTNVVYSSSDPTVIAITPNGRVRAVGPGTATLTATLRGTSDSKSIAVVPKQVMLAHRYSFTNDATDSVGGQDAHLFGNAIITPGSVVLDGDATTKSSYVELPSGMISSYDAVTLEAWVNLNPTLGTWARIIDFGDQTSGAGGISYIFVCPHTGTPGTRMVLSDGVTAANEAVLDFPSFVLDGYSGSVAAVYDTVANQQLLYTNGVLVGSAPLNGKLLSSVRDLHCWLGRSLYSGDAGLGGVIDEFRIYAGALSAAQIAADNAAGPDQVVLPPPTPGVKVSAIVSGNTFVVSWPTSATGYSLQTSTTLGTGASWGSTPAPVVIGSNNYVTNQIGQAAYFRLIK